MNINRKEFVEQVGKLLGGGILAELDAETLWLFHCELNSVQKKDRASAAYKLSQVQKEALERAEQRQRVIPVPLNGFLMIATKRENYREPNLPLSMQNDGEYWELQNIKTGKSTVLCFEEGYWENLK